MENAQLYASFIDSLSFAYGHIWPATITSIFRNSSPNEALENTTTTTKKMNNRKAFILFHSLVATFSLFHSDALYIGANECAMMMP